MRYLIVLGSVREGRQGEKVANYLLKRLTESQHEAEILDPLKLETSSQVTQPLHFRPNREEAPEWMIQTDEQIRQSDGLVIVTPEYNCTLPPALTGTLDQFPPASYRHKPVSIVSYSLGSFGGFRAAAFARPFLCELGMVPLPHSTVIPQVMAKFSDDGSCTDERLENSFEKLIKELTWYSEAIKIKLDAEGPPTASPTY